MITQSKPQYWDQTAKEFDTIYSGEEKSLVSQWMDRWLRKDIYDRVTATVQLANQLGPNQSVLDVGTGTGRLCIPLAQAGHRVMGVDFSPQMLDCAKNLTQQHGVEASCQFIHGDLLNETPEALSGQTFDLAACLGVVDYIADVTPMLQRMASFNPKHIVVSYPKAGTIRSQVRQLRYQVQGLDCPLYFYTPQQIRQLGESVGYTQCDIQEMGELYFTVYSRV